jgi:hypothetical protein
MDPQRLGDQIVAILGEDAARELLEVLDRSVEDRASLIGRLLARDDTVALGEALLDMESDPDDLTRLRLIDALEQVFRGQD